METTCLRLEREVELLNEFRTQLASDVVTGQLDVRDATEKLPNVDPVDFASADIEDSDDIDAIAEEFIDEDTQ
ncbi:MAG: hypothetical protein LC799_20165 [Actinobacteria bacterium]|nr:hypothetical protein [Actinomycetota bacterium]